MLTKPSSKCQSVDQAVNELIVFMRKTNYTNDTIERYKNMYDQFLIFAKSRRFLYKPLTRDTINKFLKCINVPDLDSNTDIKKYVRIHGKLKKLLQFQATGMISRQRYRKTVPLPKLYQSLQEQYLMWRYEEKSLSDETMRSAKFETRTFLQFLDDNGVHSISNVHPRHITTYFRQGSAYAAETMGKRAYNLRHFFRFLIEMKFVDSCLLAAIPKIKFVGRRRIPEVWAQKDVRKLIAAIDRGSPVGKRDYAICMLVIHLGLRVGDIRTIRLEHIDWNKAIISLQQQKTKNPLNLPLTEEVGNAIIDYLKNGRPQSEYREIFLRHNSPFTPFGGTNNLCSIITKYRTKAKISLPMESCKGFHSLRHNIASRLHEVEVPLPVKGDKIRIVPLMQTTTIPLKIYMEKAGLLNVSRSGDALFYNKRGTPIGRFGIAYLLSKYAEETRKKVKTIPEAISPHKLRHSKAMHLLEEGCTSVVIQHLLGHADLKTTGIYAKASTEMVRSALEKVNKKQSAPVEDFTWHKDTNLMEWLNEL